MKTKTDLELMNAFKNGNNKAFDEIVRRHNTKLFKSILLLTKDDSLAADLLQETYLKVMGIINQGKYSSNPHLLNWLRRIAYNLVMDYFRKKKRDPIHLRKQVGGAGEHGDIADHNELYTSLLEFEKNPEEYAIQMELLTRLKESNFEVTTFLDTLLKQLPNEQKKIVVSRHYLKKSFIKISEEEHISKNTAICRMRYALIKLRKLLAKQPLHIREAVRLEFT